MNDGADNGQNTPGMSLDVLAQVASETLRNEPKSEKKSPRKKVSLRTIGNVDFLTLDQILGLTEKTILNLFTEATSNEISRTFTFTCHLMPKKCDKRFSSYGSEMRAKTEIKKHIYDHLNELEAQEAGNKSKFKAEPLPARKKRLMNAFVPPKKSGNKRTKPSANKSENSKAKVAKKESDDEQSIIRNEEDDKDKVNSIGFVPVLDKLKYNSVSKEILPKDFGKDEIDNETDSDEENEKRIEENEQFIIDLLSKTQPHHDHSYTTIFGRRKGADLVSHLTDNEDQEERTSDGKKIIVVDGGIKVTPPTPILFLRHRSPDENVPMVSAEEIITEEKPKAEETETDDTSLSKGQKPYPPMPKSVLAKRGRLGFDISDIPTDGSDDEYEFLKKKKKSFNPMGREGREGNLGWEPRLALRYIRELKSRKKDENIPLKCKICNDKTFTAAATLMYHYRSHAGIKPFVCLICNTTFTRQHSLNYHMLIHNNQSRFTCSECGRKFRHPSHFKEHLRRHTGETPFECRDCGQRFKTRNTYKRHLKTRHGKLLTASGIHELSCEEFAKVRTKRYNIPKLPDISYEMPELTFTKLIEKKKDKRSGTAEEGKSGGKRRKKKLSEMIKEMPEFTFSKVEEGKKKETEESEDTDDEALMVIKTLAEIKKEVESDEDPELDNILKVLSDSSALETQKHLNEQQGSEKLQIPKAYSNGPIYVNKEYAKKNNYTWPVQIV